MLHAVAKLHYEAELSQIDIARRLGLSAATISRLLQRARTEGVVRIEIPDLAVPGELAERLKAKLGLKAAAVIEAPPGGAADALAAPAAELLRQAGLKAGSVLAIGWGRAVRAVVEGSLPAIPGVVTVAATGGMQQAAQHFQVNEFVRLAAERLGGTPRFIHAPYLPSPAARAALIAEPAVAEGVALWDRVEAAVVGIGPAPAPHAPDAGPETPDAGALNAAAGDVIRHYFDREGRLADWEGERRMIAMSAAQLRRAPLVIGVAAGESKALAILGAARAGLISALATDIHTAEAVLRAV